jgi:hypothetical protein
VQKKETTEKKKPTPTFFDFAMDDARNGPQHLRQVRENRYLEA